VTKLPTVLVGGGDLLDLHQRGVITDGIATAVIAADATIEWWCDQPAGEPRLSRLVDRTGGAMRFGPVPGPGQPAAFHTLSAGQQHREGDAVVTTLWAGEALVEIHDSVADGIITRLLTVLRGPAHIAWSWAPGPGSRVAAAAAQRHIRWTTGMSVGRCAVHGFPEGVAACLDSGDRVALAIAIVGIDGLPSRTRETVELHPNRIIDANARRALARYRDVDQLAYGGPWRNQVLAAAATLRSATSPAGGLVRAATASLPRGFDNERNVDERFAWIDDTARVVRLWERLGRHDWADESRQWLATVIAELDDVPAPVRTAEGAPPPGEGDPGFSGWRNHHPVRFGTAAANHIDLGAVASASLVLDGRQHRRQIAVAARWMAEHTVEGVPVPDNGRWSSRGRRQRHTVSALGIREALGAAAATIRKGDPLNLEAADWLDTAKALGRWLDSHGCAGVGDDRTWSRSASDDTFDAMLLRWVAPSDPDHALPTLDSDAEYDPVIRLRRTVHLAASQLAEMAMLHRHLPHVDDGFPPGQAADLGVSFEFVAALARAGDWEGAHDRWEALQRTTDGWLQLPGAIDPISGRAAGNLADSPAALSMIEAAMALEQGPS
jgi:hypothetical protein